jgi:hypothetical protein
MISNSSERATCDFCKQIKYVERTYLYPEYYVKPAKEIALKLHNEGDYFIIISTCMDCGKPKI